MATIHSKTLKIAGAIAIPVILVLLLPTVIVPLLPPLHPLTSQLLVRLREAVAFLAFTTAIAIGILSTQRKDVHNDQQNKLILEHHPFVSIFGDSGYEETEPFHADNGRHSFSPSTKMSDEGLHGEDASNFTTPRVFSSRNDGPSPRKMRSSEATMEASRTRRLLATREENGNIGEHNVHRRLHRKSSSLDDSVNYEPEIRVSELSTADHVSATNNEQRIFASNKPSKRVSFSMASSPSSLNYVAADQNIRQSKKDPSESQTDVSVTSPGDLTGQADAFIAKFKEQLRMQRLESFQRYRRRL